MENYKKEKSETFLSSSLNYDSLAKVNINNFNL